MTDEDERIYRATDGRSLTKGGRNAGRILLKRIAPLNRTFRSQVRLQPEGSDIVHEQADKCGQSIQLWLRYAVMRACGVEPEPPIPCYQEGLRS